MPKPKGRRLFDLLMLIAIAVFSIVIGVKHLNPLPPNDDGLDNLSLAVGLAHTGTMGKYQLVDGMQQFEPSNSREPFPNWVTATWIQLIPALYQNPTLQKSATNRQLILLKWPNLFFWTLMLVGTFLLLKQLLTPIFNPVVGSITAGFTSLLVALCSHPVFISTLLTEFHAACLLVWFLWAWLVTWQRKSCCYAVVAGLLLGLLILTKAAFLYISLVVFTASLFWLVLIRQIRDNYLQHLLLFLVAFVIAGCWIWRNHTLLGAWEIAGRGPNVLLTRAYKSQMSDMEFKGAFYAYAPASLKGVMSEMTGFNDHDREQGGSLQRMTRIFDSDEVCRANGDESCAIGYYVRANIRYDNIMADYAKRYPNDVRRARVEGERAAKQLALQMIKDNPWGHLRTTLVFAWRGAWPCNKVDGRWFSHEFKYLQPAWQELMPFAGLICMLVFSLMALFKRDMTLLILSWTGTAAFTFYATASHFIPRYSEMMIPVWVVCLIYYVVLVFNRLYPTESTVKHFSVSNED